MKTNELTGAALDWAVAKCEGYTGLHKIAGRMPHEPQLGMWPPRKEYGVMELWELCYSADWSQGGPIIEREGIDVHCVNTGFWSATWWANNSGMVKNSAQRFKHNIRTDGPTPLIAAMRCYVASKLGDEIELPKELT